MLSINLLSTVIQSLTRFTKWIALATMALTMFFITYAVINRTFFVPVIGDVEIVQLAMVILIMFGLAHSQAQNAHVAIGLFVDRLGERNQRIMDVFAYLLTFVITITIGWVSLGSAIDNMVKMRISTDLLEIPYYPFKLIIAVGFTLWGLEALLKALESLFRHTKKESE